MKNWVSRTLFALLMACGLIGTFTTSGCGTSVESTPAGVVEKEDESAKQTKEYAAGEKASAKPTQ